MNQINAAAAAAPDVVRICMDAKATVKIGPCARGGQCRSPTTASDHACHPDATLTPVGSLLPATDDLFVYGVTSKVTSDCLVDCLGQWWQAVQDRCAHSTTLVINLDNGPEHHRRRTQCMQRIVAFVRHAGLSVRLAYDPPDHSKDTPIERWWGMLANHWHGSLLDTGDTVLTLTASMTWQGLHPVVELVTARYATGVTLSKAAMDVIEAQITRLPGLDTWVVDSTPAALRDG